MTAPPQTAAVHAEALTKWFMTGETRTYAVHDVTFEARYGEMLYIVGPSGSGKTTLLSMISGILRPNDGNVRVMGTDIWGMSDDARAEFRLRNIGFVFQDYHLFPRLTTAENVAIPLVLQRRSWGEATGEAMRDLEVVGLRDRATLPPVKLSGGEQQRVAIARAVIARPALLLADEPTGNLDDVQAERLMQLFKEMNRLGTTVVVATHNEQLVSRHPAPALRLNAGRLLAEAV
jgi:putative ABC transport system ATP-binding protein